MCLSECSNCKYAAKKLYYLTDIGCAHREADLCEIAPSYWEMWNRLKDLSVSSIGCMPIEPCREFEELEEMKQMTLTITLTRRQWQAIAQMRNVPKDFTEQVFSSLGLKAPSDRELTSFGQDEDEQDLESSSYSMSMIPVESSNIEAIGYHSLHEVLQVNFLSGSSYRYFHVPNRTFQEFLNAHSKGRYLNTQIKGRYSYQQI